MDNSFHTNSVHTTDFCYIKLSDHSELAVCNQQGQHFTTLCKTPVLVFPKLVKC